MQITDVLDELRIPYSHAGASHHVTDGWIGVDCNRCSPRSNSFKLGIHTESGACTCWTCGRIPLMETLCELSGQPYHVIKKLLSGWTRLAIPEQTRPTGTLKLPTGLGDLLPAHRKYLRSRRFDPDEVSAVWGVQGIGIAPRLQWRLFIPIVHQGKTVSWTTRSIDPDAERRYITAGPHEEAMRAKTLLFGMQHVRHAVLVTEGPTDAMRLGPGAVATMGLVWTREQLALIARVPVRGICMDNEPEAQRRARKLCDELALFPGRTLRLEIDADDPGEASDREVRLARKSVGL